MEAGPRNAAQQAARDSPQGHPGPPQGHPGPLTPDGPDEVPALPGLGDPALDETGEPGETGSGESFRELRPPRRLRIWQIAPIVGLAILGSLMFAFPLAFEFGDGGAVVAMLGLLLSCCAAGWGLMAARRVGYTWPGLPPRGSGRRPDWRFVVLYVLIVVLLATLTFWRVARLR